MITFRFSTSHLMRSKASSSIAIFFICVPTYKKNMGNANFYCHVEKNRTGTAEMPSGQRSSIQTMHTLALMVNHAGLFLSNTFPLACFWREIGTYLDRANSCFATHIWQICSLLSTPIYCSSVSCYISKNAPKWQDSSYGTRWGQGAIRVSKP